MHETGIALEIRRLARTAAARECKVPHSQFRLLRVRVAVGELSGVDPELLELAWGAVVAEGPDQGAVLELRWCPAGPSDEGLDCPLFRRGGRELDLEQVEFELHGTSPILQENETNHVRTH